MFKRSRVAFFLTSLILFSLSCALPFNLGKGKPTATPLPPTAVTRPTQPQGVVTRPATIQATKSGNPQPTVETPFPTPPDAKNVVVNGNMLNFQTALSLKEAMIFYRDVFTKQGLKENNTLTVTSETTFSMVFEGSAKFKRIVVQGVSLGAGSINVNVRPE